MKRSRGGQVQHGHTTKFTSSPTYKSWHMMLQRCRNPRNKQYADYGGRGIKVCDKWFTFAGFLADMGERPEGTTLERRENDKGYEPGNCVWATRAAQQRNRRNNHNLTLGDRTQCLSAWAVELGLKPHSLYMRIYTYGWGVEKALTTPAQLSGRRRTTLLKGK